MFKAMAHPLRMAIIEALRNGEKCVHRIVEDVGAKRSNVSRHLTLMAKAGLLDQRQEGLWVFYRLASPEVLLFSACVDRMLREQWHRTAEALGRDGSYSGANR